MNISQYIVVKKGGGYYQRYTSRLTKGNPTLKKDEVAVRINLELPDALWNKPSLQANIVVPEEAVSNPIITADVIDNVENIIKENTGFTVSLQVIEKDENNEGNSD